MDSRIPAHAEKVFSWIRMDIYQWDQELYDGTITRFERSRFRDGAFVIGILPDGRILMTEQEQPAREGIFIGLPGGAFDTVDEDPLECARRELFEETGYESDDYELYIVSEGSANLIVYTYFYIAYGCERRRPQQNPDAWEKIRVFTLDIDGFLALAHESRFVHFTLLPYMYGALYDAHKKTELIKKLSPKSSS